MRDRTHLLRRSLPPFRPPPAERLPPAAKELTSDECELASCEAGAKFE